MDYKVEVKAWMTKPSSEGFDFMKSWNNDIPMPLRVMYGVKLGETKGMVKMSLHGDIKDKITQCCMMCGKPITNPVSKYFGLGPVCGDHNYTNPFDTEEELDKAVEDFRSKLVNMTWMGWIAKSAILAINDDIDVVHQIASMETISDTSTADAKYSVKSVPSKPTFIIRIEAPNKCTEDYSAYVSFKYNAEMLALVKALPSRFYNSDTKEWEIPYTSIETLKSSSDKYDFSITGAEMVKVQEAKLPDGFTFKTHPYSYQEDGVLYGMGKSRWLLGDHQGLGKTKQVIDLACARKISDGIKHCLIVCGVNSLKWNWMEEVVKHSNEQGRLLGQKITRKGKIKVGSNADKLVDVKNLANIDEYFIITNVESLRDTKIADALNEACENGTLGMVAIDEIHRVKNLRTQAGAGVLKLNPKYRVAMTGTPLMNSPLDLYAIMKWLGYQSYSFGSFKNYFCISDSWGSVCGYKNLPELEAQLNSIMLRRTKEEVLDLPAKVYVNDYVEISAEQRSTYNMVLTDTIKNIKELKNITVANVLAQMIRLRQVTGGCGPFSFLRSNPKLDRIEQIVEEAVYSGTKVVIFSNWQEMVNVIMERLAQYHPVSITGSTADADRQGVVHQFQEDTDCKVIIGTIGAMGTGLTLVAGTEVIFADEPWTMASKEQAVDRCHRIGTKDTVTVHTIMAHNSVDEHIHEIVEQKGYLANLIIDGEDDAQPSVVDSLLAALTEC